MFRSELKRARVDAGLSVARLAELVGTSRIAISDYEAGRKVPRVDTAERIFHGLGEELVAIPATPLHPARVDVSAIAPLEQCTPDRARALDAARRDLATIVDADANAEGLGLSWGQVKTLVNGTSVEGDELAVWRAGELHTSARRALRTVEAGGEPHLRAITGRGVVVANDAIVSVPRKAMDFLVRATATGADPAEIRHSVGAFLVHHGYPWLWVPHARVAEYRRALVACRRTGDGTALVTELVGSLAQVSW